MGSRVPALGAHHEALLLLHLVRPDEGLRREDRGQRQRHDREQEHRDVHLRQRGARRVRGKNGRGPAGSSWDASCYCGQGSVGERVLRTLESGYPENFVNESKTNEYWKWWSDELISNESNLSP